MTTFKFVLRPSQKAGRNMGSLFLRVVHNRKSKLVSIGCRLFPEEWNEAAQTILYPVEDPDRTEYLTGVNELCTSCVNKLNGVVRKLESRGHYTVADVIAYYHLAAGDGKLISHAAALSADLNAKGQYRTARAYGTVSRGLVAFNNGADIFLKQINATLIKGFENHLKVHSKQPNTISYYMRNLRVIYNKAIAGGLIQHDEKPFAGVFTGVEETKKRALTANEVNKIKGVDIDKLLQEQEPKSRQGQNLQKLDRAKRLFLFCLYAHGMCFVDMCHLKKGNLKDGVIRYYRKKTGKQIEVPVNEGMRKIIKSFETEVKGSDYLFPILTDGAGELRLQYETALRAQNRRLKRISALAGLDKGITTHVARHSWASILKNKMQPLSVISEGLGHSSEKMTRKYLASFDRSILVKAGKTVLSALSPPSGSSAALF